MDVVRFQTRISEWISKYKYAWIVLLVGILLMSLPEKKNDERSANVQTQQQVETEADIQNQLEEILGYLNGAGKVKVMLSIAKGEQTIYQTDSTYSQNENSTDTKTQTILTTDSERNENGLIHQKNPPVYLGAVVVAQGGDDPSVKLAIVEAVSNVTGLGADKIAVLKMQ